MTVFQETFPEEEVIYFFVLVSEKSGLFFQPRCQLIQRTYQYFYFPQLLF